MGYLSAIVPTRRDASTGADVVSVVMGPDSPHQERVIAGFEQGVLHARPNVSILVGHISDPSDPTECERLANEQIDQGSDVVFVAAGRCGLGAIAVARLRGVWAVGDEGDGVPPGAHVLAITYKQFERAVFAAIQDVQLNATRFGQDQVPRAGRRVRGRRRPHESCRLGRALVEGRRSVQRDPPARGCDRS